MAISIETSRLGTSFTKEDITADYDDGQDLELVPQADDIKEDNYLNKLELIDFIKGMGITEGAEELVTWILKEGKILSSTDGSSIKIDDLMTLLGGNDDKIDKDEVALTSVFAQSLTNPDAKETATPDSLNQSFNLFDADGNLEAEKVDQLLTDIYNTRKPDDIAALRTTLLALGVETNIVDDVITGIGNSDNGIRRGTVQTLRDALTDGNPDTNILDDYDLDTANVAGKAANSKMEPLTDTQKASGSLTQADFAKAITEVDTSTKLPSDTGTIDPKRLAGVLMQMGVASNITKAQATADNIIANNPDMTATELATDIGGAAGGNIPPKELRLNSYITKKNDAVDTEAFKTLIAGADDRATVITEFYEYAKGNSNDQITFSPNDTSSVPKLSELAGLEDDKLMTAMFGSKTGEVKFGNMPVTPTIGDKTGNEITDNTKTDFATAVSIDEKETGNVDPEKLAKYLIEKGVVDSDKTKEALEIANNIIKLNGGETVTAGELFKNIAGGADTAKITAEQLIWNAMVDDSNNIDVSAVKDLLNANTNRGRIIEELYQTTGVTAETTQSGKQSVELAGKPVENIIENLFGDINSADRVDYESFIGFIHRQDTTVTGATQASFKTLSDGETQIANGSMTAQRFIDYITVEGTDTVDIEKLKKVLIAMGLTTQEVDNFISTNSVTAKTKSSDLANLITDKNDVTKESVLAKITTAVETTTTTTVAPVEDPAVADPATTTPEEGVMGVIYNINEPDYVHLKDVLKSILDIHDFDKKLFLKKLFAELGVTGDEDLIDKLMALNTVQTINVLANFKPDGTAIQDGVSVSYDPSEPINASTINQSIADLNSNPNIFDPVNLASETTDTAVAVSSNMVAGTEPSETTDTVVDEYTLNLDVTAPVKSDPNYATYETASMAALKNGTLTAQQLFYYLEPSNPTRQGKIDKITKVLTALNIKDTIDDIDKNGLGSGNNSTHRSIEDITKLLANKSVYDIVDVLNNGSIQSSGNKVITKDDTITGIKARLLSSRYANITSE